MSNQTVNEVKAEAGGAANAGETGADRTQPCLLNEKQVAEIYGLNPRTLQAWRHKGGGPVFVRISRRMVLYRPADVEKWIAERLTEHSAMPTEAERAARTAGLKH